MAEYPNNSHSARERTDSTAPGKAEKKLEKVVTGAAKTRKKSEAVSYTHLDVYKRQPLYVRSWATIWIFGSTGCGQRWLMKRHTYIWTSIWSSRRKSLTNY